MVEALITDWLEEYSTITEDELTSFAAQHQHNHEVAAALFAVFHNYTKYLELTEQICDQLFSFYRSTYKELKLFALQFLPTLIYLYLNAVVKGEKKKCHSVETFLISVYNLEILDDNGQPRVISFRMPFLAQHSIYHEAKGLAQTDLRRWEECSAKSVNWGPLPHIEVLFAQNRLKVMTALLFIYNRYLSLLPKASLHHLCKAATMMMTQGFPRTHCSRQTQNPNGGNYAIDKCSPRLPLSGQFLLELLHAVYFAMFNEFASIATSTVEDIHKRAVFELYSDVILVTNAIKHSLADNPSGQPCDGPMGISVAISTASTTVTVSKSMITNASFRTKKLPDDLEMEFDITNESSDPERTTQDSDKPSRLRDRRKSELSDSIVTKDSKYKSMKKRKSWSWKYGAKNASLEETSQDEDKNKLASIEEMGSPSKKSIMSSPVVKLKNNAQIVDSSIKSSIITGLKEFTSPKKNCEKKEVVLMKTKNVIEDSNMIHRNMNIHDTNTNIDELVQCTKFISTDLRLRENFVNVRQSAGARLCRVIEDNSISFSDEGSLEISDDLIKSWIVTARPASVHLLQTCQKLPL